MFGIIGCDTRTVSCVDSTRPSPMKKDEAIHGSTLRHVALQTFNLVNCGKLPDAPERVLARSDSTEVYSRIGGTRKIIHSYWSYGQPEPKQTSSKRSIAGEVLCI
jgi:hypothetical protein